MTTKHLSTDMYVMNTTSSEGNAPLHKEILSHEHSAQFNGLGNHQDLRQSKNQTFLNTTFDRSNNIILILKIDGPPLQDSCQHTN